MSHAHEDASVPLEELLRCPVCGAPLRAAGPTLHCTGAACQVVFPVVNGVPVLINEARSVFAIRDFTEQRRTTGQALPPAVQRLMAILPEISHNMVASRNYARFARLLRRATRRPRVLVVGGGALGEGITALLGPRDGGPAIELVETDVYFGPRTRLICDAHDLPFAAGSFDGVIVQAVLEHVADPFRCVAEIWRVLKPHGLVYAETPFMQQVHLGAYDFMRFTHLGHRKLFSRFAELRSGPIAGPGMVLAWAVEYLLLSFTQARLARMAIRAGVRLTLFWLKYVDYLLIDKAGTYDAASGFYFLGRKSDQAMADRDLITGYRGALV